MGSVIKAPGVGPWVLGGGLLLPLPDQEPRQMDTEMRRAGLHGDKHPWASPHARGDRAVAIAAPGSLDHARPPPQPPPPNTAAAHSCPGRLLRGSPPP